MLEFMNLNPCLSLSIICLIGFIVSFIIYNISLISPDRSYVEMNQVSGGFSIVFLIFFVLTLAIRTVDFSFHNQSSYEREIKERLKREAR